MTETLIPAASALLGALVGTLGTLLLAERQHKHQLERDDRAALRERKVVAIQNAVALFDFFAMANLPDHLLDLSSLDHLIRENRLNTAFIPKELREEFSQHINNSYVNDPTSFGEISFPIPNQKISIELSKKLIQHLDALGHD